MHPWLRRLTVMAVVLMNVKMAAMHMIMMMMHTEEKMMMTLMTKITTSRKTRRIIVVVVTQMKKISIELTVSAGYVTITRRIIL